MGDKTMTGQERGEQEGQDLTLSFLREAEAPFDPSGKTEDYVLESSPIQLLGPNLGRWVARVRGAEGVGILIYESTRKIAFFRADEAITLLACLMEEALPLLLEASSQLRDEHQETLEALSTRAEQNGEILALLLLLRNGGGER